MYNIAVVIIEDDSCIVFFFFFQAEDGIRDLTVTGVQTCALPISYQWKTTDGMLLNVNGAEADWLLPSGPGLHYAYVLVSNGKGGYAERRVRVKIGRASCRERV